MKTDRELLELAAKAAGLVGWEVNDTPTLGLHVWAVSLFEERGSGAWNPIDDDGDALRLAVGLGLVVDCSRPSACKPFSRPHIWLDETESNEALTRRAIVAAAAEIGEAL